MMLTKSQVAQAALQCFIIGTAFQIVIKNSLNKLKMNLGRAFFQSGIAFITFASTDASPGACSASQWRKKSDGQPL
jgi:hypothetical protein